MCAGHNHQHIRLLLYILTSFTKAMVEYVACIAMITFFTKSDTLLLLFKLYVFFHISVYTDHNHQHVRLVGLC